MQRVDNVKPEGLPFGRVLVQRSYSFLFCAGDVSAKATNLLLRFIYTNKPTENGRLPGWLMRQIPEGVEEVFDAADRFLVFPLKVNCQTLFTPCHILPSTLCCEPSQVLS